MTPERPPPPAALAERLAPAGLRLAPLSPISAPWHPAAESYWNGAIALAALDLDAVEEPSARTLDTWRPPR